MISAHEPLPNEGPVPDRHLPASAEVWFHTAFLPAAPGRGIITDQYKHGCLGDRRKTIYRLNMLPPGLQIIAHLLCCHKRYFFCLP